MEKAVQQLPGVIDVKLVFNTGKLKICFLPTSLKSEDIVKQVTSLGYRIDSVPDISTPPLPKSTESIFIKFRSNPLLISMIISGSALIAGIIASLINLSGEITTGIFILGILSGIILPARSAFATLITLHELDINALMVLAVTGAIAIGEVQEGLVVVFLFSLGNFLQIYTFDKTRNSIRQLIEITPRTGLVRRNNEEILLPVTAIEIGDTVIVRPGQTIPVDGTVIAGSSSVNQAPITGEAMPVNKQTGSEVFAGTLNEYGVLEIRAEKLHQDTALQKIIQMVEEAQAGKALSQQLIDRFARLYTPIVMGAAVLVAVLPPWLLAQPFEKWLYEALALLLVACPCALIISTPVAIVSAIGNAARNGILIKGGSYLEALSSITVIAFDKTGTLTKGKPQVSDIIVKSGNESDFLAIAAAIEKHSEHPLARAVVSYTQVQNITVPEAADFLAIPGSGTQATIDGKQYYLGNVSFLQKRGIDTAQIKPEIDKLQNEGKTVITLTNTREILGIIGINDTLRPDVGDTITKLKKLGIKKTLMLTGDNHLAAANIKARTNIDLYKAELLPENKAAIIKDLLNSYGKVAMVGDGINDTPALATSTVGIAMGAAGSDTALETADIALMGDDLSKLPLAINLSRKTVRIIKQNIVLSLLIKGIIFMLIIPGWLTMWLAITADVGTSLLVTLNGMRLLRSLTN